MRHLYRSLVEVLTDKGYMKNGSHVQGWARADHMFDPYFGRVGLMMCRLDLNFLRPGKDEPAIQTGGRAPDRVGVMFCDYTEHLKAGMLIHCVDGPIKGTFEIKLIPDEAQDYVGVHHLECGIVEMSAAQRLSRIDSLSPNPENLSPK